MHFMLGFTDELVKISQMGPPKPTPAQKKPSGYYSPKPMIERAKSLDTVLKGNPNAGNKAPSTGNKKLTGIGWDKFWGVKPKKTIPQTGPRPAPGTRMPPKATHMPPGPKKFAPPKPKGPVAEGIVPATFQRRLPNLPSGKKMPRASGTVSEVASRKRWEAANKPKLPEWMSDEMKKPVKGHPMAKAEDVARSKKEDAEAKGLVSEYTKKDKPKTKRRGRRFAAKDYGPSREDLWRMVPGKTVARTAKGGGSTGPTGIMRPHRTSLTRVPAQQSIASKAAPPWKRQPMTIPGYKAIAKKRTI